MLRSINPCSLVLVLAAAAAGAERPPTWIGGRVVDAGGRPVAGADVASYWSGNGWQLDAEGKVVGSVATEAEVAEFWGRVGRMEPIQGPARTGPDGSFRIEAGLRAHHVVAMDAGRSVGGPGIVPPGAEGRPITIRLEPPVRVRGLIRGPGPGERPGWTHVYALRAEEPGRPVDNYRVGGCGSFAADFSLLLPPGRYQLNASNAESSAKVSPNPDLTIKGDEGAIDLGTLRLSPRPEALVARMQRVKAERQIADLKDRVGQSPPPVFAADARGVARDWQPGRAPGKWQVLELWGMGCVACVTRALPDLIGFQEQHPAQADRFEIVSVFLDVDGKVATVAQLDEALKPIIKHVWGGKGLPFPTLVDPTYRTAESFGLTGYGEMVLIDPAGKIVAGDLDTLRAALAKE